MVVNHEAKEEEPSDGLSTNSREYFTRTNLVKIKNTITDRPNLLALYCSSKQMFLVGRNYKSKLKPTGLRITLYKHQMLFFYMHKHVTHESNLTIQK